MIRLKTAFALASAAALSLLVSGCESSPFGFTPAQLNTLRTEPIEPLTIDYQSVVRATLHNVLKDPMSAVFEFSEPVRDMHLLQPFNAVLDFHLAAFQNIRGSNSRFWHRVPLVIHRGNFFSCCPVFVELICAGVGGSGL